MDHLPLPSPTELMLTHREMAARGIEVDLGPVIDLQDHAKKVLEFSATAVEGYRAYCKERQANNPSPPTSEDRAHLASFVATLIDIEV